MSNCVNPLQVINKKTKQPQLVPCGRCYNCRMQTRAEWTFRLTLEQFEWPYTSFLTLTYNEESLPFRGGSPSLYPVHLSKFIKDLRNSGYNLKYYAVGEYGGRFGRPHYHCILFHKDIIYPQNFWPYGNLEEERTEIGCLHYVGKHHIIVKKRDVDEQEPVEPFSRMSKKLGIAYIEQYIDQTTGEITEPPFSVTFNGYHYPLPRYYRKKLSLPIKDKPFTFAIDKLEERYPNLSSQQIVQLLYNLQLVSLERIKEYNQLLR